MKVKCKDCKYYVDQMGCGTYYPPAKCDGEIARECDDFVNNETEENNKGA